MESISNYCGVTSKICLDCAPLTYVPSSRNVYMKMDSAAIRCTCCKVTVRLLLREAFTGFLEILCDFIVFVRLTLCALYSMQSLEKYLGQLNLIANHS